MAGDQERLEAENTALRAEIARLRGGSEGRLLDLDALFPALPALLFLFDGADRYLDYRAGQGLFAPPSQFLGKCIDEVLPQPTARVFREAMARARVTGAIETVAYALPMPAGERHFEARISALPGGRLVMLCLDLTDQRAAEEAARRHEAALAQLTSLVPSVVYGLRLVPGGVELDRVSANLERLLGYTAAQAGQPGWWSEQVHPEDRESATAGAARVLAEGQLVHTYRFRHADGRYRWIRDELRLIRDGQGRPAEVVGSFSDVTVEREAQEQVRRGEQRFRSLIERSSDLVMVFDQQARISFASPASEQVLGVPPGELVGREAMSFTHPDDAGRLAVEFGRLLAEPATPQRLELRVRHRDGSWRTLSATARNLLTDPAVRGIVVNNRDVTEERRLGEQVLQAQKLESVGRLAGGVAHDFNNLLIGILGYAEILEEDLRAGRAQAEDVAEIRRAGERARDLTRQLLAFARRQMSRPVVLDLAAAVRDAEKLLRRLLGEDVDVEVDLAGTPLPVKIDATHLQQVILNLAVNARDAMPRGGKLTLESARVDLDGRYADAHPGVVPGPHAMLAVSDSGEGMSQEVQAHLFEPFYTTKPSGVGTGLGLATAYGIVKQSGGNIWVYSEPGRGTTFKIYLPLTDEAPAAPEPIAPRPGARGAETVLVVEDDAPVRELTVRALRTGGYRVLVAAGGRAALELAAATPGPIDLLLTDVVMPDLSGKQVADALLPLRPGMRVLYVSGYTQNTIVHHGVLDRGVEFLAKPFTPSSLLDKVRSVLDG